MIFLAFFMPIWVYLSFFFLGTSSQLICLVILVTVTYTVNFILLVTYCTKVFSLVKAVESSSTFSQD